MIPKTLDQKHEYEKPCDDYEELDEPLSKEDDELEFRNSSEAPKKMFKEIDRKSSTNTMHYEEVVHPNEEEASVAGAS